MRVIFGLTLLACFLSQTMSQLTTTPPPQYITKYNGSCLGCLTSNKTNTYCTTNNKCAIGVQSTCTTGLKTDLVRDCSLDQCANNPAYNINFTKVNTTVTISQGVKANSKCSVVFNCQSEICRVYLNNTAGSSMRAYMMQSGFSSTADIKAEINPFGYYSFRGSSSLVILIVNTDPTIANSMSISYSYS